MCNEGRKKLQLQLQLQEEESGKNKARKRKMNKLMKFQELPQYMKDNEYILDYYRCEWPLKDVFFSVFSWHNETLNIWTHLVGFLIFLGLTLMSLMDHTELGPGLLLNFSRDSVSGPLMTSMTDLNLNVSHNQNAFSPPDSVDLRQISGASSSSSSSSIINNANISRFESESIPRWPWFVFLSGAMGCLICSSLSHLLACHSKRFNFFFWRLDYAGISLMIVSSFFAPIYYAFSCNPYARFFYLSSISLLGILAIITLLSRSLSAPRFRSFRATLFLSMGFSGVIPALHAFLVHWGHQHIIVALGYELAMAILYASGAAFYVTRIPERWKPGKFDIAGHSHQIFHVFVVLGALAHTLATLVVMDFRRASPTCASASY